jgi:epoxyqueuosine reductase
VLLGVVLTTAALEAPDAVDDPAAATWDACGSCTRCLDACPTAAFVAPGELDPRRCISYLTIEHRGPIAPELADAMGERIAGCDVCQEVCPYNASRRRDGRIPEPAWLPAPRGAAADVEDLTRLVNVRSSPYRAFVRHTALRRIPRRSMRRNVLLALGNRPGPLDDRTRQEVEQAAADDDPQVAAAARRVLARRGP